MTKVITAAAVAALTVTIIAVAGTRTGSARVAKSGAPKTVLHTTATTTTTEARAATSVPSTTAAAHRGTSLAPHDSAKKPHPGPPMRALRPAVTTTTVDPAQQAAEHALLLQACLDLAAANNSALIAANDAWYETQLHALAARKKPASAQYNILQIEETQAQSEIQTQYAIDHANCYLK